MFNKHTTTLYAAVIASVLVASVFGITFVQQQAAAQGNQTTGAAGGTNQSSTNSTSSGGAAPEYMHTIRAYTTYTTLTVYAV